MLPLTVSDGSNTLALQRESNDGRAARQTSARDKQEPAMNVFDTHSQVVDDYAQYIRSFINISDPEIARKVEESLSEGRLWPQPLLQFNPAYEQAGTIEEVG